MEGGRAVIARDDTSGGAWVHLARNEFPKQNEVGGGRVVYFPYYGVELREPVELREAEVECLLELEYLLKDGLINSLAPAYMPQDLRQMFMSYVSGF